MKVASMLEDSLLRNFIIQALTATGVESVPVLKAAFSDPNQSGRRGILWGIRWIALNGHTNECMSILIAALEDQDANVRASATNFLQVTSTNQLLKVMQ